MLRVQQSDPEPLAESSRHATQTWKSQSVVRQKSQNCTECVWTLVDHIWSAVLFSLYWLKSYKLGEASGIHKLWVVIASDLRKERRRMKSLGSIFIHMAKVHNNFLRGDCSTVIKIIQCYVNDSEGRTLLFSLQFKFVRFLI